MMAAVVQFALLLGVRRLVRELVASEYLSMELFNQSTVYKKLSPLDKSNVVSAIFHILAVLLFLLYYIVQTAACSLVHGLLPSENVRYVLLQSILLDYVEVMVNRCSLDGLALHRAQKTLRGGKYRQGLRILLTETIPRGELIRLATSRRGGLDIICYFYFWWVAQYDTLNVAHCAFIHVSAVSLCSGTAFIAALGLLGCDPEVANSALLPVGQFEKTVRLVDRVLHGVLITKFILGSQVEGVLIVYICALPVAFRLVDVGDLRDLK